MGPKSGRRYTGRERERERERKKERERERKKERERKREKKYFSKSKHERTTALFSKFRSNIFSENVFKIIKII